MTIALFWCAGTARGISTNHARLICCGTVSVTGLKTLLMPRLADCSCDLDWHWINWTLFCDTMEVSALRLAWLPIAQYVFWPALTSRLELILRKIVSCKRERRLLRLADFAKNCLPWIACEELPRFCEKYRALGRQVCKIREIGGKKWGPTCDHNIFNSPNIHDRDISGVHCNTIRVLIGFCKFWGPWVHRVIWNIVVYGIVLLLHYSRITILKHPSMALHKTAVTPVHY